MARQLSGGERHLYRISLKKNQFVSVVVEQLGIDVVLTLSSDNQPNLITVDSPNGSNGPERLPWVAGSSGPYTLEIRSLDKTAKPGRYQARIDALRNGTPQDWTLTAATGAYSAGVLLYSEDTKESARKAVGNLEKAAPLWHELNDAAKEANTLKRLGWAWRSLGEPRKALDYYRRAMLQYQALRDRGEQAALFESIGHAWGDLKDKDQGLEAYRQAKSEYIGLGFSKEAAAIAAEIGKLHANAGEKQKALDAYVEELSLRRAAADQKGQAVALNKIGVAYFNLGDGAKASEFFNQALSVAKDSGDRDEEVTSLVNLGYATFRAGNAEQGLEYYNRAVTVLRAIPNRDKEAQTLLEMGVWFGELADKSRPEDMLKYRAGRIDFYRQARSAYQAGGNRKKEAETLLRIGDAYREIKRDVNDPFRKPAEADLAGAMETYEQARTLSHAAQDAPAEARALVLLGEVGLALKQQPKTLSYWQQAISLYRANGDKQALADLLSRAANLYYDTGEKQKARESFEKELPLREELRDQKGAGRALAGIGRVHLSAGDGRKALDFFQRALPDLESAPKSDKDADEQAAVHRYMGLAYFLLKDDDRAREAFNAEFLLMKAKNLTMLAMVKKSRGAMELWDPELVQKQERILASPSLDSLEMVWEWLTFASIAGWDPPFYELAQTVFRANGDVVAAERANIATVLQLTAELGIANEYLTKLLKQNEVKTEAPKQKTKAEEAASLQQSGKFDAKRDNRKALASFQKALELRREIGDRQGTAETLMWLGDVWFSFNENRKALDCYLEARGIQLALGRHVEEAEALSEIGMVHNWIGERRTALEFYGQALVLFREAKQLARQAKDKAGEAKARAGETTALHHMGESYFLLGEKQKALEQLDQAQAVSRDALYPDGDPATLSLIGLVYASLSDQQKSQDYYRRAVTGFQRKLTGGLMFYNLQQKGVLYNELGDAYSRLGQTQEAVGTFLRGLVFQKEFGNRSEQAYALNQLGEIYLASRDPQERGKAMASFQQALELRRQDGNPSRKAEALHNLGSAYEALGDRQKALPLYHQALAIRHRLKDPEAEGETLDELMRVWKSLNQPRLAIYYGKQAVNALQQIRLNIQGLDKDIQKSFLNSRSGTYRELADLLITEGRLPEAQQVLDLLKKDEFLEFIRREGPQDASGAAVLSVREAQQELRFRQIQDRVVAAGERFAIVTAQENPTAEERQEMSRLERELSAANDAYERYLTGLPQEFAASGKGDSTAEALREAKGLQETLRELGDHTVALYTVVTEKQYHVILFTPETQIARSYPIQPADLNRKVQEFRAVLLNPNLDPVPLAQELYKILVGPVAKDLADAHAKTLMWSLDGTLRYVPISALHDGAGYLMEKYRIAVFTPASRSRLEKPPTAKWRGLGLGVSKGAIPLPYVTEELEGIIHDSADPASSEGVLAGKILLDDSFTKTAMKEALLRGRSYPLVHVASHFRFKPGNEFDSYLLLGGEEKDSDEKRHLTLAEIKSGTNIFRGVELLTLSACNTAVGSGEGAEIENFAVLAQLKGARAVVATLWPVDDRSTMRLMQTFYRLRNDSPGQPKVEALRQAQLSLLRGATAAYAHPYFWAPFILIGNWR